MSKGVDERMESLYNRKSRQEQTNKISGNRAFVINAFNIIRPLGQAVKTPPFHGGNTGSNPVGVTMFVSEKTNEIEKESHTSAV